MGTTKRQEHPMPPGFSRLELVIGLLVVMLVGLVAFLAVFDVTEIDVDASSGRVREQRWLGPIVVSSRIVETEFSLYAATLRLPTRPERWHCDRTSSFLQPISPYYRYHGVSYALGRVMQARKIWNVPEHEMARTVSEILDLLNQDKPDDAKSLAYARSDRT